MVVPLSFSFDRIFRNSIFRNISGSGIDLASEKDDKGIYNAEYTTVENCIFTNLLGSAVNIYRGGNDESTLGPFVKIDHCTFNEVENREQGTVVRLLGVQQADITNCIFSLSGQGGRSIQFQEFRWDKIRVDFCNFFKSGRIESFYNKVAGPNIYHFDPQFKDVNQRDFNLISSSSLTNKSTNEKALGAAL